MTKYFLMIPFFMACSRDSFLDKGQNIAPTIMIMSHSDGFEVLAGATEELYATVSDDDDNFEDLMVSWYLDGDIVCEATQAGEGGDSTCDIVFAEENEKIIAEVRDSYGSSGRMEISAIVIPSEAPEAEILSPLPEDVLYSDQLINFSALVSDAEDENEDLFIQWSSSVDGELSLDTSFDTSGEISDFTMLSFGQHAIELRVEDTTGRITTDEVVIEVIGENTIPDCEILDPLTDSVFPTGDTIQFSATATDINIANDLLTVEWISDKDGTFGSSIPTSDGEVNYASSDLSDDSHTITMRVTDEVGATCTDQVLIELTNAPIVTIDKPIDGDMIETGSSILFEGTVTDVDDAPNNLQVEWYSSVDGELYLGSPFSNGSTTFTYDALSPGIHVISLTAEDPGALTGDDVITLTINSFPIIDSLTLSPAAPSTTDTVTCEADAYDPDGGSVNIAFTFSNQTTGAIYAPSSTSSTSATLDLSSTGIVEDDILVCSITVTDSLGGIISDFVSAPVGSETPSFSSQATITPGSGVITGTNLSCSATATQFGVGNITPTFAWTINGSAAGSGTALSVGASNTDVGDLIECTATATGTTGIVATSTDSVTVENSAPALSSLSISPNPAYIDSTITCSASASDIDGDTLSYSFDFTNQTTGTSYGTGSINGSSTSLDLNSISVQANDVVICTGTVSDTNGGSASQTDSVTISNDPTPYFSSATTITPNTGVITGTALTCSATATQAGQGNINPTYAWTINGSSTGSGTSLTVSASNTDVGDTITCTATVIGTTGLTAISSDSVTVDNTAPSISSVSLSPSTIYTNSTLTCSTSASDADNDSISYSFAFSNVNTGASYGSGSINGTSSSLNLGTVSVSPFDTVRCTVTATDTNGGSASDNSSLTVSNDPTPYFTAGASISPSSGVVTGTNLTCTATAAQAGGTPSVAYTWKHNGSTIGSGSTIGVSSGNSDVGGTIECLVTATGTTGLTATSSDTVTVENTAPTVTTPTLSPTGSQPTGTSYTCSATGSDADNGSLNPTYTWFVGGSNTGETGANFSTSISNSNVGDSVYCQASVTDSNGASAQANSSTSTIINTPPTLSGPQVQCLSFGGGCAPGNDAVCNYTVSDIDGNASSLVEWYRRAGSSTGPATLMASGTDYYTPSSSNFNSNDWLECRVTATDPSGSITDSHTVSFN